MGSEVGVAANQDGRGGRRFGRLLRRWRLGSDQVPSDADVGREDAASAKVDVLGAI